MEQEELRYQSMYRSSKHDGDMSPSSFEQFKVRQHAVWISILLIQQLPILGFLNWIKRGFSTDIRHCFFNSGENHDYKFVFLWVDFETLTQN